MNEPTERIIRALSDAAAARETLLAALPGGSRVTFVVQLTGSKTVKSVQVQTVSDTSAGEAADLAEVVRNRNGMSRRRDN